MLTSRERVITAINHKEPDRVPIAFAGRHDSIHVIGQRALKKYFRIMDGEDNIQSVFLQTVFPDERLVERFKGDTVAVFAKPASTFDFEIKDEVEYSTYIDEFGVKLSMPKEGGYYFDYTHHPLLNKSLEEIRNYPFPDPVDSGRFRGLREDVRKMYEENDKAIVAYSYTPGIFDLCCALRGFEQTFMDLALDIKLVETLSNRLLEWMLKFWEAYLKEIGEFVQVIQIGDDLGGQNGPLFNPKLYRSLFKPMHKELITLIKKHTDAKVYFHSCGSIFELIPDLVEAGVDIINPVQYSCKNMEARKLKEAYGKDVVFWGGGCDPQTTFWKGTPKEVKEEVKKQIEILAPGGGYIFSSIHNIQYDVSPEKVEAFFDAAFEYGKY